MKVTEKVLLDAICDVNNITDDYLTVSYWNGTCHILDCGRDILVSGTKRECFQWLQAYRKGYIKAVQKAKGGFLNE